LVTISPVFDVSSSSASRLREGTSAEQVRTMEKPDGPRLFAQARGERTMPPPRDPEKAVREEYQLALARGTAAALELFIARHADHPLAAEARRALERMKSK
jgi:hypothetical protein